MSDATTSENQHEGSDNTHARMTGGCACGAVKFELSERPTLSLNCHCSRCRGAHGAPGAAFGTFTVVAQQNFCWTQGESCVSNYESSPGNHRKFCSRCGAPLTLIEPWNPHGVTIVVAALDQAEALQPSAHMFVASKAPWFRITDDLPQHPEWPPGLGPVT